MYELVSHPRLLQIVNGC